MFLLNQKVQLTDSGTFNGIITRKWKKPDGCSSSDKLFTHYEVTTKERGITTLMDNNKGDIKEVLKAI